MSEPQGEPSGEPQNEPTPTGGNDGKTYSQADIDRMIDQRISKERAKYGMTPDEAKAFREQFEALDAEGKSEAEKREKAARKAAAEEADAKYQPKLAETAFRVAIGDRVPASEVDDFIGDLNLSRFITEDGNVDTAKVLARVAQITQGRDGKQQQAPAPKGPVIPGHTGTGATSTPGDPARAWLAKQGIKVDS